MRGVSVWTALMREGNWKLLVVVPGGGWSCCGSLSRPPRTPGVLLMEAAGSRGTAARGAGGRSARMALEVGRGRKLLAAAPGEVWNCRRSVNSPMMVLGGVAIVYFVATAKQGRALVEVTIHPRRRLARPLLRRGDAGCKPARRHDRLARPPAGATDAGPSYLVTISDPDLHFRAPPFHPLPRQVVPLEPLVQVLEMRT